MAVFRHVMELTVSPFFLCIVLLGICVFCLWRRISTIFVTWALSGLLIILLTISSGWLPRWMTHHLESQYPVVTEVKPAIKWVVVLSGGQSKVAGMPANDLLSSASMKRLIEGIRLFRQLPDAQLVLSGGGSVGDQAESLLLAQLAEWFAIPSGRIVLEQQSINTADQARELIAIVHEQPFYLVTSAIHMPRSMALCLQQGLHPIAAPTDFTFFWNTESWAKMVIPNAYNLTYFSIATHEFLGRIWAGITVKNKSDRGG